VVVETALPEKVEAASDDAGQWLAQAVASRRSYPEGRGTAMYRDARRQAGMSIEDAAYRLHIGTRTLTNYEHGVTIPPPEVVASMARVYNHPGLTVRYCRMECTIGRLFGYEILDAIDASLPSVVMKLAAELDEARAMVGQLLHLVPNKQRRSDFREDEWREFTAIIQEFFDVEHAIEVLKHALGVLAGVDEVADQIGVHNRKCVERGYARRKKAACAASV
jgi:transcriptional regulator with XRE-family HTH domain